MTANDKKKTREAFVNLAIIIVSMTIALGFIAVMDFVVEHKFETKLIASRATIFSFECAILVIIVGQYIFYEFHRFAVLIGRNGEPEAPRFKTGLSLLGALACSLAIYLIFVWAWARVSPSEPKENGHPARLLERVPYSRLSSHS